MSEIVYRICPLLEYVLTGVPIGTNLGLLHLLFASAVRQVPARARSRLYGPLSDFGLPKEAVRRAEAALCYGRVRHPNDCSKTGSASSPSEGHFVVNQL